MSFDELVSHMGTGRYQLLQVIFCVTFWVLCSLQVFSSIFIAYPMPFKCTSGLEETYVEKCNTSLESSAFNLGMADLDQCQTFNSTSLLRNTSDLCSTNFSTIVNQHQKTKCRRYQFMSDGTVETSIVAQFNLVCDKSWYKYLLQSVFMVGVCLNGLVFGKASDRFGRKRMILVMVIGTMVSGMIATFVNSLYGYIFMRAIIGFFCFYLSTCVVLCTEMMTPKWRTITTYMSGEGFSIGLPTLLLAYFIRTWKALQVATTLCYLVCLGLWWFMDESPRWLIAKGREEEAIVVLEKIAARNRIDEKTRGHLERFKTLLKDKRAKKSLSLVTDDDDVKAAVVARNQKDIGITDMLRKPHLRKLLFVLSYSWMAVSCAYYGLTLNVASVGGNVYFTTLLMGAMSLPALPMAAVLCHKLGRRFVISGCFILAGVSCIPMYFVPLDNTALLIVMFLLGRTFSSIPFTSLYLYAIELHPTIMRSTAVNFGSSQARIGAIIAPAIAMLEVVHPTLPNIAFGFMTLLAGILILLLPDTRKSVLFETMDEGEAFIRDNPGPLQRLISRRTTGLEEAI